MWPQRWTAVARLLERRYPLEFSGGFGVKNLQLMKKFYVTYPNANALRTQLTWTHYRPLLFLAKSHCSANCNS